MTEISEQIMGRVEDVLTRLLNINNEKDSYSKVCDLLRDMTRVLKEIYDSKNKIQEDRK